MSYAYENKDNRRERLRLTLKRRARTFVDAYEMKWTEREWHVFVARLVATHHEEGIDDFDLRTLVRMYNRECLGRRKT